MNDDDELDVLDYAKKLNEERNPYDGMQTPDDPNNIEELDRGYEDEPIHNPSWEEVSVEAVRKNQQQPTPFVPLPSKERIAKAHATQGLAHGVNAIAGLAGTIMGRPIGGVVKPLDYSRYNAELARANKQNDKIEKQNAALLKKNEKEVEAMRKTVQAQQQKTLDYINSKNQPPQVKPYYRKAKIGDQEIVYDSNVLGDETIASLFKKYIDSSGLDYRPTTSEQREMLMRYSLNNKALKAELKKNGVTYVGTNGEIADDEDDEEYDADYIPVRQKMYTGDRERYTRKQTPYTPQRTPFHQTSSAYGTRSANINGYRMEYNSNKFTDESVINLFDRYFDASAIDRKPTISEKRELLLRYSLSNAAIKKALEKEGVKYIGKDAEQFDQQQSKQKLLGIDASNYKNQYKK